jgi:hypothetical protein
MALWATMAVTGPAVAGSDVPVIANQPINTIVTVYNSGAVALNILSGQGFILPVTAGGIADNEVFYPGYNQVPAAVAGVAGTFQFDLTFILFAPQVSGIIGGTYTIGTVIYMSDGSVLSANQTVATTTPVGNTVGGQGGVPLAGNAGTGQQFFAGQIGFNYAVAPFLTPAI